MVIRNWRTTDYVVESVQIDSAGEKLSYEGREAKKILRACNKQGYFRVIGEFDFITDGRVVNVFYSSLEGSSPVMFPFEEYWNTLERQFEIDEKRIFEPRKEKFLDDYVI